MNSPVPIYSSQMYVGIQYGYIIIPSDVDRSTFINQCYRWERVSVLIEKGAGVIHDCYITREAILNINFPETSSKLGSCVLFLTDPLNGHPVVFGVLSKEDESQLLKEGVFKFSKHIGSSVVEIIGDASRGVINMTVNGGSVSQLNITATNSDGDAAINIKCQGNITIEANAALLLKSLKGAVIEFKDTLKLNTGSEAMVLGDELKTQIEKTNNLLQALINIISGAPIPEPGNGANSALQAALTAAITGQTLGDFSNIKSAEAFLD
jgi:hypothetical protein